MEKDWNIYKVIEEKIDELEKGKSVVIGKMENTQQNQLHDLLIKNSDLFAQSLVELQQSNIKEHAIITEDYKTHPEIFISVILRKITLPAVILRNIMLFTVILRNFTPITQFYAILRYVNLRKLYENVSFT